MNIFTNKSIGMEVLKGAVALLLAIIIFTDPARALVTIATYLGVLALIAGFLIVLMALYKKRGYWQMRLAQGIINALLGLLVVVYPEATAGLLIFIVALWITFFGIMQLTAYLQTDASTPGRMPLLVGAILSMIVGVLLLFNPFEGAVLATVILGAYAVAIAASRFYTAWLIYRHK